MRNLLILCVIIVFGIIGSVIYVNTSEELENTSTNVQITIDDNKSVSDVKKLPSKNLNNTLSKSDDLKQKINVIKAQNTEVDDLKASNSSPNINMLWITIVSLIVASLSILVSLYLYYWRYKLIVNQDFLIPEKVVAELGSQSDQFNKLSQYNIQVGQLIESQT
ncbi:hypothetical protein N9W47_05035, partial [Alphaproteobacteria bacterium]|nr:hypothetical protein [Alphaproteobacteria bacterium]